ncbi:terminase small subunit [Haematospirillum sp. H1815]|uniref:terminase small subunit n=1 Tax=Haematospirillum sp. H1815 TaxID=2723108 RepID=UPI00143C754A|nr:terminase small subunit [Haematospirillum sp. H1815]NKD76598.1 terminase small subunit [Haematospirillum sp. H1815]
MSGRKGAGQEVNRTAIAQVFGVALPTIDQWVQVGCPFVSRGSKGKAWIFNTADVAAWREDRIRQEAVSSAPADEQELKLRHLLAVTRKAELALLRESGELAPLPQVEKAIATAFAEVRANLRNIPGRVVARLIGETDAARLKAALLDEIDGALETLASTPLISEVDLELEEES